MVEMLEHDSTKELISKELKKHGNKIRELIKAKKGKGVEILGEKLGV